MPPPDGSVVVTGAAGYLGGRVASALGTAARAIVRNPVPWLPEPVQVACDLLGPSDRIVSAMAGASAIVHLAGHNEVLAAAEPDRGVAETVAMAEAVLTAARRVGVERIIYVSTIHVYGEQLRPGATVDETAPSAPTSAYARARLLCEEVFHSDPAVGAVVLRLSNAVGAPADPTVDRWTLVASDLCRQGVLDRQLVLRSTGLQWRDFITLEDACRMVVEAMDHHVEPGIYNLTAGRACTVRALAELIQDRVEHSRGWRPALHGPAPDGPPDEPYTISAERLASQGVKARVPLVEGIDEIIEHCVKHEAVLRRTEEAG